MIASISYPKTKALDDFITLESTKAYTYSEVGTTRTNATFTHYDHDYNFIKLGKGAEIWQKAKAVLRNWQHFPLPWTKIYPNTTELKEGAVVVVMFNLFGIWWRNSAKIVYTFDEPNRFGFAYGTLPGHVERGEEVFWIERNEVGMVSYHIKAFSKPQFWLAKIGYPIARFYQRKFAKDSIATMQKLIL